jgi:hypothetical protein
MITHHGYTYFKAFEKDLNFFGAKMAICQAPKRVFEKNGKRINLTFGKK